MAFRRLWRNGCDFCGKRSCGVMTIRCFRQRGSRWEQRSSLKRRDWSKSTGVRLRRFGRSSAKHSSVRACRTFIPTVYGRRWRQLGQQVCNSPEEFKAWSQNLGHEQVLTTLPSYGKVATDRQGAIIRGLGAARQSKQSGAEDIAEAVVRKLQSAGAGRPAAL